jgi:hypothetical protein
MSYCELWAVLSAWKKEFTTKEFAQTFLSPDPNKVLHDMTKKGMLNKTGWGRYKVNTPEQYLAKNIDITKSYETLEQAGKPYALTGQDAVFFWTQGGYQVDRFFGFYPIHLKVKKQDLTSWKSFFASKKEKSCVKDLCHKKTLFGVFYVLYPEDEFAVKDVNGFCVSPLWETVEFCQKNIYAYEPALEMLDTMYGLGLQAKYMETATNQ